MIEQPENKIIERLKECVEKANVSYSELEKRTGISKSALQRYISGTTKKVPVEAIQLVAKAIGVSAKYIMGWNADEKLPDNIIPMPKMRKIPLLGNIACGEPILAVENIEDEIDIPDTINADFALRCKGDSMINARINDGDIVYIKQDTDINNGDIAAVLIEDEATLKRVYRYPDKMILQAENPAYEPLIYIFDESTQIRLIGKAVGFTSRL